MNSGERGLTLTELLVASAVGTAIVLAMTSIDLTRFMIQMDIKNNTSMGSNEALAGLAGVRIAKDLERADRINVINSDPDVLQLRIPIMTTAGCTGAGVIPPAGCFNIPANFRWSEYRLSGASLQYFEDVAGGGGGCPVPYPLVEQITALNFERQDRAQPPPGGEPAADDNNIIEYLITWDDTTGNTHSFRGEVTSRAISYTDLSVSANDSGLGLLIPSGLVPPQCT